MAASRLTLKLTMRAGSSSHWMPMTRTLCPASTRQPHEQRVPFLRVAPREGVSCLRRSPRWLAQNAVDGDGVGAGATRSTGGCDILR